MGNVCGRFNIRTAADVDEKLQTLNEAVKRQEDNLLREEQKAETYLNKSVDDGYEEHVCQGFSNTLIEIKTERVKLTAKRQIIEEVLQNPKTRKDYKKRINAINDVQQRIRYSTKHKKKYVELEDMRAVPNF